MDTQAEPEPNTQTVVCAHCRVAYDAELPSCVRAMIIPKCDDCLDNARNATKKESHG